VFEKLIRDRIPELAAAQSRVLSTRIATEDELDRLLGLKLIEEAQEVIEALHSCGRQELLDELADVQTVIDELAYRKGISKEEVKQRVAEKLVVRGGFSTGLVLREPLVPHRRLHVGGASTLVEAICKELLACVEARIAVAFVMRSGLDLLEGPIRAALLRGVDVKMLTTDYLGVTEPEALARMLKWDGRFEARVYSHERRSFHPKAYLFRRPDGTGRAFIGSANMSRMGLREGVEWTWTVLDVDAGQPMVEIDTRFDELFVSAESQILTPAWVNDYQARRQLKTSIVTSAVLEVPSEVSALTPRVVQSLALAELQRLRADGQTRALVVAATGLGKTYLAAFDAVDSIKVLFIAHREELLKQAAEAFAHLYPKRSVGFVMQGAADFDRDCVFASVQTLSRPEYLSRREMGNFDYVVIDEFHHAAADSYQRVLQALQPKFLLGITATPFRSDNRDLLELCHGNLAYQVGLFEAISFGWLAPFRYHGVADVVAYTADLLNSRKTYDINKLTLRFNTNDRARLVTQKFLKHKSKAALGFCVSIEHADFMAAQFLKAGITAAAVHSGPHSATRGDAIRQLTSGHLKVLFSVDIFNEGVDIPVVDLVMFLRPTESMVVFIQQLGRGLRLHPEKPYLTVLDFIGNYRNAHYKLPFLVGQDLTQNPEPAKALKAMQQWATAGIRPDGIPEGVTIEIDPVALATLRESLNVASPLRQLVLDDLLQLRERLGRVPAASVWQRQGRYSLATARTALGVDRWNRVLQAAELLSPEASALEQKVGEFLREIEKTAMSKSFKMVVLLAMCTKTGFQRAIHLDDLARFFRTFFSEERHRSDIAGQPVENAETVAVAIWSKYILENPINAWIGGNTNKPSQFFSWSQQSREFKYIGPSVDGQGAESTLFGDAVLDRATARLVNYWGSPGPGRFVFSVIPTGAGDESKPLERSERGLCIMFGDGAQRSGVPEGWHAVRINGEFYYGKFVKIALNVLKIKPTDDRNVPNELTPQLHQLLTHDATGTLPPRPRIRLLKSPVSSTWEILAV